MCQTNSFVVFYTSIKRFPVPCFCYKNFIFYSHTTVCVDFQGVNFQLSAEIVEKFEDSHLFYFCVQIITAFLFFFDLVFIFLCLIFNYLVITIIQNLNLMDHVCWRRGGEGINWVWHVAYTNDCGHIMI